MRTVILESPLAPNALATQAQHVAYALKCVRDCMSRGEAPFASHLLYPQCYDDAIPAERELGIAAGLAIGARLEATVVYLDFGLSTGMRRGVVEAVELGRAIYLRRLDLPTPGDNVPATPLELNRLLGL